MMDSRHFCKVWDGFEMFSIENTNSKLTLLGDGRWEFVKISKNTGLNDYVVLSSDPDARLLQCTGLADKNGNLIYEGDILQPFATELPENRAIVKWGGYSLRLYYPDWDNWRDLVGFAGFGKGEIIGNIYENPDLLQS